MFLLALAIVDDIGAIIVIAVFYSDAIDGRWLAVAAVVVAGVVALRRAGVSLTVVFVALGSLLWLALHASGVHATLAGVAMGLLAPATPRPAKMSASQCPNWSGCCTASTRSRASS